jgi:hypothetical protein
MVGKRPCRVVNAITPSSRASRAPRQWWMPWPKARWLVSARARSRVSGLAYRAGSRLAAASEMITWAKAGMTVPPRATSWLVYLNVECGTGASHEFATSPRSRTMWSIELAAPVHAPRRHLSDLDTDRAASSTAWVEWVLCDLPFLVTTSSPVRTITVVDLRRRNTEPGACVGGRPVAAMAPGSIGSPGSRAPPGVRAVAGRRIGLPGLTRLPPPASPPCAPWPRA